MARQGLHCISINLLSLPSFIQVNADWQNDLKFSFMRINIRRTAVCCKRVSFLKFEDKLWFNFFCHWPLHISRSTFYQSVWIHINGNVLGFGNWLMDSGLQWCEVFVTYFCSVPQTKECPSCEGPSHMGKVMWGDYCPPLLWVSGDLKDDILLGTPVVFFLYMSLWWRARVPKSWGS